MVLIRKHRKGTSSEYPRFCGEIRKIFIWILLLSPDMILSYSIHSIIIHTDKALFGAVFHETIPSFKIVITRQEGVWHRPRFTLRLTFLQSDVLLLFFSEKPINNVVRHLSYCPLPFRIPKDLHCICRKKGHNS